MTLRIAASIQSLIANRSRFATASMPGLSALFGLAGLSVLAACGSGKPKEKLATVMDLDSLHRVNEHKDSTESNLFFYEHAFDDYKVRFPGVDKPHFMSIARGKDQDFCLFKPNPAQTCLEVADKFNDLGLRQPAKDAYVAGLLSEGTNGEKVNVRLWSSMAQIHFDEQEYEQGKSYLTKILEVEPRNIWAKKLLASTPK